MPILVPSSQLRVAEPVDISIIIAHRGPEMGLWMTIESCIMDLSSTGYTYEFRVCSNGEEKISDDLKRIKHFTEKSGHMGEFLHVVQPTAPPTARQMITEKANGRYLFFFDNHCIPTPGYFTRGVSMMDANGIDFLHSTTRFFEGEGLNYSYELALKRDFWTLQPYRELPKGNTGQPYRVACAGHGGFAVRSDFWKKIGGYYQGFDGYGGEETSTDLKVWRMGGEVWLDPKLIHLHWAGERAYKRHFTDDYFRNMYMSANIIGGDEWLARVFSSTMKCSRFINTKGNKKPTPIYDLMLQAQKKSNPYAKWINEHSIRTLDEVLEYLKRESIPS